MSTRVKPANIEVKTITVDKFSTKHLGATIVNVGGSVVVRRVVKGGALVDNDGLSEGDEILQVNDVPVKGRDVSDVCRLLKNMDGTINFSVASKSNRSSTSSTSESQFYVRAQFDYDSSCDLYLPCQDLGMSFSKRDVLCVVDETDQDWWQAYKVNDHGGILAGLIPSKLFHERRESLHLAASGDASSRRQKNESAQGRLPTHKLSLPLTVVTDGCGNILTYERVELYLPPVNRRRPLVLVGAPCVGRKELHEALLLMNPSRYVAATPHTSRPRVANEVNGRDYHFVPKDYFLTNILQHAFVEYGKCKGHYYGTTLDAIRRVYLSGKTCVLSMHPQSLHRLRHSGLLPYIIYIAPPEEFELKRSLVASGVNRFTLDGKVKSINRKAKEAEIMYGHYFDAVVSGSHCESLSPYEQLLNIVRQIDEEPQWVPFDWLHNT